MAKNPKGKNQRGNKGSAPQPRRANGGGVSAGELNRAAMSPPPNTPAAPPPPANWGSTAPAVYVSGLLLLAIAATMTVLLVIDHFDLMALPGCGEGGGCAEVTRGKWGKVPGTGHLVSFVGLAYFLGLLIAWALSPKGVSSSFKVIVRVGVLLSLGFIAIMIAEGHLCWYCLITHQANLAFWLLLEFGRIPAIESSRAPAALGAVFALATAGLFVANRSHSEQLVAERNLQADESVQEIIAASTQPASQPAAEATVVATDQPDAPDQPVEKSEPFTGRYRTGPEAAPVRMLMITDYQCPDCRAVEAVAKKLVDQHKDVSLSIKHFPFDQSCNRHMSRTMHGNACWAARAAETAGLLRGNEGFWEMHHWLFDRKGSFTDAELNAALAEMGYDPQEFTGIMTGPQTLELVQADIEEAGEVGVFFTPMIFINGVHLRGVFEANADKLRRSVEVLLAQNLPALTAEQDRKPTAIETVIGDWREEYQRRLPPDSHPWLKGPATARLQIVLWGDFQEEWTAAADRAIVKWLEGKNDVSYSYRHFPFNQACNSVVSRTAFPHSCTAAKAAEAAGLLAGVDGYWKMHDWLMSHRTEVNDQSISAAAQELGFEAGAFTAAMADPQVAAAIEEDCKAAKTSPTATNLLLYRGSIPTIFINGRATPRFRLDRNLVIDRILDAAREGEGDGVGTQTPTP
ncbi:MAG TPA: DsbA family protein [Phycisphaerae bacterium]|nr:DsbA family protein [Phycisphaerae bacterium]